MTPIDRSEQLRAEFDALPSSFPEFTEVKIRSAIDVDRASQGGSK